jgi:uncharacterized protein
MPKFKNLRALAVYRALTKGSELVQSALPDKELGQLVLNISQGCNLGCPYCFADKGQYGSNEKGFMSFETAKLSIDAFISKYNAIKSVKFFGGEPSLNFRLIQEVCHYFDHLVKIGRLSNVPYFIIVTNLTILTHEMLDYYSKYKFRITVSLDGPEEINDTFRMFDNRTGSFHLVDKNIRVLKDKIGKDNMGIESVYSPQHVQNNMSIVDLHKYFLDRYGMESITIHPLVENEYSKYIYAYFPQKIVEQYYNTVFDVARIFTFG